MTRSKYIIQLSLLVVLFSGFAGFNFIKAYSESVWFPPAGAPPTRNVVSPINRASSTMDYQMGHGNLAFDQLTAFTQVNSSQYCDLSGENCIGSGGSGTSTPSIYNNEHQYFEQYVGSGDSIAILPLGNWTFCSLARQKTTADDNNMYDGCYAHEIPTQPGFWELIVTKSTDDSLICGAQCLYLGDNRITTINDPFTYAWNVGQYGSCFYSRTCSEHSPNSTAYGVSSRSVGCYRSDGQRVSDTMCPAPKPVTTQSCSMHCN